MNTKDISKEYMTPKFSVVLIAKNEEKTLPKLIASLSEFKKRDGEIILVDTGSTDSTVEVAKKLGCIVTEVGEKFIINIDDELGKKINEKFIVGNDPLIIKERIKIFNYSDARNFAASLAKNNFVAMPDCDEEYTKLDIDEINKKIDDGVKQFEYNFVYSHDQYGNEAVKFIHSKFYDRRFLKWTGIIHEVLTGDAKRHFFDEKVIKLEHWQNVSESRSKYLAGLALDCFLHPEKDRNSHYFAREMYYKRMWKSAAKEFERHIEMNKWQAERAQSMIYLGDCYLNLNKPEDALRQYQKACETGPARRLAWLRLADLKMKTKDFVRSIAYAKASLEIPHSGFYSESMANYTHEPHYYLYVSYGWVGGKVKKAQEHNDIAIDYAPQHKTYLRDWKYYNYCPKVSIVIPSLGREDRLKILLQKIKENANYDNYEVIVEMDSFDNRKGVCNTFNSGVEKSTGELVMFLGNDCIPQENFLVHAVRDMSKNFKDFDGMLALSTAYKRKDGVRRFLSSAHFLISKKLLNLVDGKFFNPVYHHYFCDSELAEICKNVNKHAYSKLSTVMHQNPTHGTEGEFDEVCKIASFFYKRDMVTYIQRMKDLGFYSKMEQEDKYFKSILKFEE